MSLPASAHTAPADSARRGFQGILVAALLVQCLGAGLAILRDGSALAELLWQGFGFNDRPSFAFDRYLYLALVASLPWGLWRGWRAPLFGLALWFFLIAILEAYLGGSFAASYAPLAYAVRFACPWALAWLVQANDGRARASSVFGLLSYAAAAVFAVHGLEAFEHNPAFLDYLIRFCRNYAGMQLSEYTAGHLLYVIGTQDILLALLAVLRPRAGIFAYMAFWGALTAAARVLHSPSLGWPMALIRASNAGVPLALWWGLKCGFLAPAPWFCLRSRVLPFKPQRPLQRAGLTP